MKRQPVDFSATNGFPKIVLDYVAQTDFLKPFYKYSTDISAFTG